MVFSRFTFDCASDRPLPSLQPDLAQLRDQLTLAVKRRLMTQVPWGVLLSGGLDSSVIASIAVRLHRQMLEEREAKGEDAEILGMGLARKVSLSQCCYTFCLLDVRGYSKSCVSRRYTHSQLDLSDPPILLQHARLLNFWAQPTTSTRLLCKKA